MLHDMKPEALTGDCRETILNLYGLGTRRVFYSNIETPYPDGRLIVSVTDLRGIITHCNNSFVVMSGYSREDLIGAEHSILRHPDMPAIAFKRLWGMCRLEKSGKAMSRTCVAMAVSIGFMQRLFQMYVMA
jgi:aerotaxis receptor